MRWQGKLALAGIAAIGGGALLGTFTTHGMTTIPDAVTYRRAGDTVAMAPSAAQPLPVDTDPQLVPPPTTTDEPNGTAGSSADSERADPAPRQYAPPRDHSLDDPGDRGYGDDRRYVDDRQAYADEVRMARRAQRERDGWRHYDPQAADDRRARAESGYGEPGGPDDERPY